MLAVVASPEQLPLLCKYMGEKIGQKFAPEGAQGFAILNDTGVFVAGVLITNFRGHDCEISCATETSTAWRPHIMKAVFTYIFIQLQCKRCSSIVRKSNKRSRDFLKALGFALEGNLRKGYDGEKDALIYGLLSEDCRYIGDLTDG